MVRRYRFAAVVAALSLAAPASGDAGVYWQCAKFARSFSGIQIFGDAHTWWSQADERFSRGSSPRVGAVLAFTPTARMRLGHVATVTRVVSDREITVTHANWSMIGGTRGQIERDVPIRDVSLANDWSSVRVWYASSEALGTTAWPVSGFIYPQAFPHAGPRLRYADLTRLEAVRRGFNSTRLVALPADVIKKALLEQRRTTSIYMFATAH